MEKRRVGMTIVNADVMDAIRTSCEPGTTEGNDPSVRTDARISERLMRSTTSRRSGSSVSRDMTTTGGGGVGV